MSGNKIKRLFAFGSEFTNYHWPTWADIFASDLSIPLYNYGEKNTSNRDIFNSVMKNDILNKFTDNDIVTVQWVSGSIDDLALVKAVASLMELRGCEYHFISSDPFLDQKTKQQEENRKTLSLYDKHLAKIQKDFSTVLWKNDIEQKHKKDNQTLGYRFMDSTPSPIEHLEYFERTFWKVNPKTKNTVQRIQLFWIEKIKSNCANNKLSLDSYSKEELFEIKEITNL